MGALADALAAAGLPTDDLADPGRLFLRFADAAGAVVGHGGLELYGTDALLRSVVVEPGRRGTGFGRAIVAAIEAEAARHGATSLYLLTTTAAPVFAALGYAPADRDGAPAAIRGTAQFAGLCPASAAFLVKRLRP